MDSPQPPGTIADTTVKLLCLDQIQLATSVRNLEGIKGEEVGWKKKYIKNDLLTLKTFIEETHATETIINQWINKAAPSNKIASTPQLILHVDHYMELIGFKLTIERAVKTFNDAMNALKKDKSSKDGNWILQQYREARAKRLRKAPQPPTIRIQAITNIPIEILVTRARAEATKIGLVLVALADPKVCHACSLIGHEKHQCSLREEATAQGMFETEELRQQFQNDLEEMLEELNELDHDDDDNITSQINETTQSIESRKSEQTNTDKSNSAPEEVEKDLDALDHIGGAETTTSGKEQTFRNSPESTTEDGGEYYMAASTGQQLDDVNLIPEEDPLNSSFRPGHQTVLVVQSGALGDSSDSDLSTFTYRGGSTFSGSPQLPSQHQYSDHEEYETEEDEPENQGSLWSRHSSTSSRPGSSDSNSSSQLGPLPCHVLSFHKRSGQYLESSVYARYRENGNLKQIKIGNTRQIHKRISQQSETLQGIVQAAEVIKRFSLQNKATLIPTTVNFFHSCEDFTKAFDKGDKEPFEEIQRIVMDKGFPYVYIQQTEYPPNRTESNDKIAERLYVEWNLKSPRFRKLNRRVDRACRTDVDHDPFSFVRKCDFVVICSDKFSSTAVQVFARHEDTEDVRLRTLQTDYISSDEESKELSIKTIIAQACRLITSYIQESCASAQIGEILIVHGSKDIESDLQIQRKSYVFNETYGIISRTSPQATIWFMKIKVQEDPKVDFAYLSNIFWKWFQSKDKIAYLNPVQDESLQAWTPAQQAEGTTDRSSKDKDRQQGGDSPLLSSPFQ
ncbi:hypothetical protein CAEBREN_21136 [Caenorhabditis brenneri]|uniref:Uncharacterized protein n=1 Tax=Caenorhabditis brenneri TaxID=135651 RepID=G0P4T5_CAEBE|nr:hypothetical protein CAEBREN_21136 [Caenorhabditis brenneri]